MNTKSPAAPARPIRNDARAKNSANGEDEKNAPSRSGSRRAATKARILLVEDHEVVREGLARLINHETDMEVCGVASSAGEALEKIGKLKPDLLITDISMEGMNGIEFLKQIKVKHPKVAAIVLSMHDEETYAERALRAGALAFVMKTESSAELMSAIRKAQRGEFHVSERVESGIFERYVHSGQTTESPLALLSDRELEVFELLGHGRGSNEIAEQLRHSVKTVDTQRSRIKAKLKIHSFTEMIQRAVQWVEHEGGRS
jgi:DNA-binding NarL/FixJ family response regulator